MEKTSYIKRLEQALCEIVDKITKKQPIDFPQLTIDHRIGTMPGGHALNAILRDKMGLIRSDGNRGREFTPLWYEKYADMKWPMLADLVYKEVQAWIPKKRGEKKEGKPNLIAQEGDTVLLRLDELELYGLKALLSAALASSDIKPALKLVAEQIKAKL